MVPLAAARDLGADRPGADAGRRRACSTRAAGPAATSWSSRDLGPAEGVDISPQAVEFCHRRGLKGVHEDVIEELPFEDGPLRPAVRHRRDRAPARRRAGAGRAAAGRRPRGRASSSPCRPTAGSGASTTPPGTTTAATRARMLDERVQGHGWEPDDEQLLLQLDAPPGGRCPHASALRAPTATAESDLHLSPGALDRWLELPVRGEAKLIRRGVSLPAGVSLGMVCTVR